LVEKKGKKEGGKWVTGLTGVVDDGVIANYSHAAGRWHGAASRKLSAVSFRRSALAGERSSELRYIPPAPS
jgi:hypothetical protein